MPDNVAGTIDVIIDINHNNHFDAVKAMQADGTLSKLSVKWYGVDYTVTQ